MKTIKFRTVLFILLVIVFLSVMNLFNGHAIASSYAAAAPLVQVPTPTPDTQDHSVIGSTNGILVMGIIITMIVILPLFVRKKRNSK